MAKRAPITSRSETIKVAQAAQREFLPPAHTHLNEADMPFWNSIIDEKPKVDWTAHDLELAALLAQSMRQLVEENQKLDEEGSVITTVGGNAAQNPRLGLIRDAAARAMKYRQTLGIHAVAKGGSNPKERERRKQIGKQIEEGIQGDDPRFARPTFQ